jgi:hypothetical protein
MSSETELYAALSASVALAAIVSTKIYPDAIPEDKTPPAVVYQRASTAPVTTIGGVTLAEDVRFAITAWAATRASAESVSDQVAAAIAGVGNPYADRSTGYDPECGLYAVTVECDWWHSF